MLVQEFAPYAMVVGFVCALCSLFSEVYVFVLTADISFSYFRCA